MLLHQPVKPYVTLGLYCTKGRVLRSRYLVQELAHGQDVVMNKVLVMECSSPCACLSW